MQFIGAEFVMEAVDIAISVEDLYKSYGVIKAVDGLSFNVNEGEVYSLLGPNGAGKTTTVEIVEGIRRQDKGKVLVLGKDPWQSRSHIRENVGIMPQDFRFVERINPEEAIKFYCSLFGVKDRSKELLELVELEDVKHVYFQNLSGGQKQKLGICLALVNNPRIVFLDEPTTGLDPRARRRIWKLINQLKKEGRTIFLTTHYLEEAQMLADRVGIVFKGKMLVEGTPREIIEKKGRGKRLLVNRDERLERYVENDLGLEKEIDGDMVSFRVESNREIMDILTFVETNGIPLQTLQMREDTLEDIFIDLVGKEED